MTITACCSGSGEVVIRQGADPQDLETGPCPACSVRQHYIVQIANVHGELLAEYRTRTPLCGIGQSARRWTDKNISDVVVLGEITSEDPGTQLFEGAQTEAVWSVHVLTSDYILVCSF